MKIKLLFLLTLVAGFASADVLEVRLWKAIPGNSAQLTQHASEARSIQQKLGGQVVVATDRQGRLHYATAHKNWVAWAAVLYARSRVVVAQYTLDPLNWHGGIRIRLGDELLGAMGRDTTAIDGRTFVLDGPAGVEVVAGVDAGVVRDTIEAVR